MNFEKAYKELLAGKKIRRKEWEPLMHLWYYKGDIKTYKSEITHFESNANILQSNNWKVIDSDDKLLTFVEALDELRLKKCITREDMQDSYIFIDNGVFALCKAVQYDFMPTFKCLCSHDWEVLK